jgi:23S rRNA (cytosine1962-C5)-methyltransferase
VTQGVNELILPAELMTKQDRLRPAEARKAAKTRSGGLAETPPKGDRPSRRGEGGKGSEHRAPRVTTAAGAPVIGATISRRASDRIRNGHVWVYASDVESIATNLPGRSDSVPPLLPVADNRGLLLGTALYSPTSQIALRMISHQLIGQDDWLKVLGDRLRKAIARRGPLLTGDTNACRLCFSEADELPGIIVDKYGDLIVLQLLVKGLDSAKVRSMCVGILKEELSPTVIVERPDPRVRELEGLSLPGTVPLWAADAGASLTHTAFHLNGLEFHFDTNAGQKTGAFLDQRANYAAAADWAVRLSATNRALDVCTYQGGFALHLARTCQRVTGIDASRASLEVAERNLITNRERLGAEVDWVEADAFELLRDWSDGKDRFDAIVLDPPAFAKTQRAVEGALRGYKELNLRALKMLRPGGLLVTCSCSHHVGWNELEGSVASAASDARRRVRLLERRGAAPDHPVILNIPETEYLKCLVLEVE